MRRPVACNVDAPSSTVAPVDLGSAPVALVVQAAPEHDAPCIPPARSPVGEHLEPAVPDLDSAQAARVDAPALVSAPAERPAQAA
jgi:hypothetical protein